MTQQAPGNGHAFSWFLTPIVPFLLQCLPGADKGDRLIDVDLSLLNRTLILRGLGFLASVASIAQCVVTTLGMGGSYLFLILLIALAISAFYFSFREDGGNSELSSSLQLTPEQAAAQLNGQSFSDRVEGIVALVHNLPDGLSGEGAAMILDGLAFSDRVAAVQVLKPKLNTQLTPNEIALIVGGTAFSDRTAIIQILNEVSQLDE